MKKQHNRSIKHQILFCLFVTFIVIAALTCFAGISARSIISKKNDEYISGIYQQIQKSVTDDLQAVENVAQYIAYDNATQKYLQTPNDEERFQYSIEIHQVISKLLRTQPCIKDVAIIGKNGNNYGVADYFTDTPEIIHAFSEQHTLYSFGMYDQLPTVPRLLVGLTIYDMNNIGTELGIMILLIDTNNFGSSIKYLAEFYNNQFYLIDRNQNAIVTNASYEDDMLTDILEHSGSQPSEMLISYRKERLRARVDYMEDIGGYLVSIINERNLFYEIRNAWIISLVACLVTFLLLSVLFAALVKSIVNPLMQMTQFMTVLKNGDLRNLKKRISLNGGYREINDMAQEFNHMLDEINQLTHRLVETSSKLYEAELLKKESELAFLRAQINPHFLYNTLESIKAISSIKGVYEVRDMAKSLARIFRYSIKGIGIVQLREEFHIIRSYVQIQQIRFPNRFLVKYDLPEEILSARIVKMILQPIVENAIYHGLEPKRGTGTLILEGQIRQEHLLSIRIMDDGIGMNPETLHTFRMQLQDNASPESNDSNTSGIGILNVQKRIVLTYGPEYGISLDSTPNQGTCITINLPYLTGE